jgi:parallel beta-helix repeat protein
MSWTDNDKLTPTNLNAKSGLVFNVKDEDYGAVGDGTTDDTTAIRSAVSAAAGNGTVVLSGGTYVVTSGISLYDQSRVYMDPNSAISATHDAEIFHARGSDTAFVTDVVIEGGRLLPAPSSNARGVRFEWVQRGAVRNTYISDPGNNGINVENCDSVIVEGNNIEADDYGVFLYRSKRCRVYGNHIINTDRGVIVKGSYDTEEDAGHVITANAIEGYATYGVAGGVDELVRSLCITGNTFRDGGTSAKGIHSGTSGRAFNITGNTFHNPGNSGVDSIGSQTNIVGNTMYFEGSPTAPGISLKDGNYHTVIGNRIVSPWRGIYLSGVTGATVTGNHVTGAISNGIHLNNDEGIVRNCIVVGNAVSGCSSYGIYEEGSTGVNNCVFGNTASGCTLGDFAFATAGTKRGMNLGSNPSVYTGTNVSSDREFDADTVAVAELADVVGTLIADLRTAGIVG